MVASGAVVCLRAVLTLWRALLSVKSGALECAILHGVGQRELARTAVMEEICDEARRQLARDGAAALSLRSVAREGGMVSAAVYRYVASRDELLTLLIIDAYNALADHVEAALGDSTARDGRGR